MEARDPDFVASTLNMHLGGKIHVTSAFPLETRTQLSRAYTPGVAEVCRAILKDPALAFTHTIKSNSVAVVTDGTAVLGLGNIGPLAAEPVMAGKAMLFSEMASVDAFPICIDTTESDEIVRTVELIAPVFGAINLEDISAPRCFDIEERLDARLDIPVFHDDQHGTAVVVLAALINALRLTGRDWNGLRVVVVGAGAAGIACMRMLLAAGVHDTSGLTAPVACMLGVRISRRPSARSRKRPTHAPLKVTSLEPLSELMFSSVSLGPRCYVGAI